MTFCHFRIATENDRRACRSDDDGNLEYQPDSVEYPVQILALALGVELEPSQDSSPVMFGAASSVNVVSATDKQRDIRSQRCSHVAVLDKVL